MRIKMATTVYHGTRGELKWWEGSEPFPNRDDEDGGVSFTLDVEASPKTKNASWILDYEFIKDVEAIECRGKHEFYNNFRHDERAVQYAEAEKEIKIASRNCVNVLRFVDAWKNF